MPPWRKYLDAITREIHTLTDHKGKCVRTIYAGGGTPTLLAPEFYDLFFERLGGRFQTAGVLESTIETDGQPNADRLAEYAQAGFDRVSIGLKSFHPHMRKVLGAGDLLEPDPVTAARSAGFSSVNLDLVYGFEGQGMDDLAADLERAVCLNPDHISLYALEESGDGGPREGDPDVAAAMFRMSAGMLQTAGYRQYEITNFARPGRQSLHNKVYWEDGDYLGLGPSAHSSMTENGTRIRWRNLPDIKAFLEDPVSGREEISRESGEDRAREALILALRLTKGVHRPAFALKYGFDPVELIHPCKNELVQLGLIRCGAVHLRLTTRGMLLSNEVFIKVLR